MDLMELSLSQDQRLVLRNQYKILLLLDPGYSEYYGALISILEGGYQLEYEGLCISEWQDQELDASECSFIVNLLNLYCEIWEALEEAPTELSEAERFRANFPGLSGHHLAYAHHLIAGKSRAWGQSDYGVFKNRDVESSTSHIMQYKDMVAKRWPGMHNLTADNIHSLLDWKYTFSS